MFDHCLYCDHHFPANGVLEHVPLAGSVAYDPQRGRLWAICGRCGRWNLAPLGERVEALDELERLTHDRARLLFATANIAMLAVGSFEYVRVGRPAAMAEEAWWRYGRGLMRDRRRLFRPIVAFGAAALGAASAAAAAFGHNRPVGPLESEPTPHEAVLRWGRFGELAWEGRAICPHCGSVRRSLPFIDSGWLYLRTQEEQVIIGAPCNRCDPWTPEKLYRFQDGSADSVLRRSLAYRLVGGASEGRVLDAVRLIEAAGSGSALLRRLAEVPRPIGKLDRTSAVALEIAANEHAERRTLRGDAFIAEFRWKQAERLAEIMDTELAF